MIDAFDRRTADVSPAGAPVPERAAPAEAAAAVVPTGPATASTTRAVAATSTAGMAGASASPSPVAMAPATPPDAPASARAQVQAAPALPAADAYAMSGGLDPGPELLSEIELVYPEAADGRSGTVVIRILIDEAGHVDDVAVAEARPPNLFEEAAQSAFRAARFAPGKRLGIPVKSQITIEVAFTPLNRGARVSGRSY